MPHPLTHDPNTGKLSRLKSKDLSLIGIDGLNDGDPIAPFGTLTTDIIEYCLYTTDDEYIASGEIHYPIPTTLDIGKYVRQLGYNRGTYKIVFNFLRQIGGSSKVVLTKKSDKSIHKDEYFVNTDGKMYAGSIDNPLLDENNKRIELLVQEDKFWLQEISNSRTEIRLRPNPAINDPDINEQFRLLGYTCLSYSDISGESNITIEGNTATITGGSVLLKDAMKGGTLIIREAFIIDYDETPEVTSNYTPTTETTQLPITENFIVNGHFKGGEHTSQIIDPNAYGVNEIVEFSNPGHSKYCLRMTSVGGVVGNQYRMSIDNLIPGETYVLSCWVMWTDDWDSLTDQGIFFLQDSNASNILNYTVPGIELEEKIVDGYTWKRLYERFTTEEETVMWIFGYNGDGNTNGYRYFTDIQLEPGSGVSLPTPYMIHPRTEEVEAQSTGFITFIDNDTIQTITSDEDPGFNSLMESDGEGRGSGILTIKDAIVINEREISDRSRDVIDVIPVENTDASTVRENGNEGEFHQSPFHTGAPFPDSDELNITLQSKDEYQLNHISGPDEESIFIGRYKVPEIVRELDELIIGNQSGGQIREYKKGVTQAGSEGKFHWTSSPYHGTPDVGPSRLTVRLAADNKFSLYRNSVSSGNLIGNSVGWYATSKFIINDFEIGEKLIAVTKETSGTAAGFIARISYKGIKYNTGDNLDMYADEDDLDMVDVDASTPGVWEIADTTQVDVDGEPILDWAAYWPPEEVVSKVGEGRYHSDFKESSIIWGSKGNSAEAMGDSEIQWEWTPATSPRNYIWRYPDPSLGSDAIWPNNWSAGPPSWNWGGEDFEWWRTQWVGYHGKWTRGEGRNGGNTMKFIDQNSQFQNPNHTGYTGMKFDAEGNRIPDDTQTYGYRNYSGDATSLIGRYQFIDQWLSVTPGAQGIQHGDKIKVSWWQKSEVEGKGALVVLRYWKMKMNNGVAPPSDYGFWSSGATGPGTYSGVPNTETDSSRRIYVTEAGVWEKAEFTFTVDDNWDLFKTGQTSIYGDRPIHTLLRVYGEGGPEGILWVEDVKLTLVDDISSPEIEKVWTIPDFQPIDKLRVTANKKAGEGGIIDDESGHGFISKIDYKGAVYKTGDPEFDYYPDSETGQIETVHLPGIWKNPAGTITNHGNPKENEDVAPDLKQSEWIWPSRGAEGEDSTALFEWQPIGDIVNYIWNYPDPALRTDAIWPDDWTNGFDNFNFNNLTARFRHTGWTGHHAKFVPEDGRDGGACMKFIDQNSEFQNPNHENYTGLHATTGSNASDDTLIHRPQNLSQTLNHNMASQGITVGDKLNISWRQKSDTVGKGARVGLLHNRLNDNQMGYGPQTGITHSAPVDDDTWLESNDSDWLRYIPVTKAGEWQEVNYDVEVDENFDLMVAPSLRVLGNYGTEGILWVENLQITWVLDTQVITREPEFGDLVGEIESVIDKNTVTLKKSYGELATDIHGQWVSDNDVNIRPWSVFPSYNVSYISSMATKEPVYGSLRGEIKSVNGNQVTLVNTYTELGNEVGHDFEQSDVTQGSVFNKWFVQYPQDKSEDLSKLVKLGRNEFDLITNFKVDQTTYPEYPYSVVYKLYEPLPDLIQEKDFITIVREMIPPVVETCTLLPFVEEWISETVLRPPERNMLNSPIGSGTVKNKNYGTLGTSDTNLKKKLEDEILSGSLSANINVDFSLFEKFIHFSSAEQRVRNFKYKLDQVEQYTDRSASLAGAGSGSVGVVPIVADPGAGSYLLVSGSSTFSPSFTPISGSLAQVQHWETKRRETINSFDKFEKYMFDQSSSYSSESIGTTHDNAWPKRSGNGKYLDPYVLARTSQSIATTWYSNQIVSASAYDKANKNRLKSHLPMFVQDDSQNDVFLKFIDMIGHHFDDIWVFIGSMTDIHDKRDKLTEGIAKDLLKPVAASLGWEVSDGKDLISLPRYMFGVEQTGSEKPWEYSGTPERDISREIWSRIVNNMPYFLKTKGTARAIKGLISCYGIPSSILRVIEYGGPKLSGQSAEHFLTRKFTKALNFFGSTQNTYVQNDTWKPAQSGSAATNRVPDTVEFRFKAATGSNQVLVRRGDDWAIRLKDNGSSDRYGYVSFMLSGSHGYNEVTSSELPVYDNEFWSVMVTRTLSGSGNFVTSDTGSLDVVYSLYTKKYGAGRSKIIYESKSDLLISGSQGVVSGSYNIAYSGSATTVTLGGPEHAILGESLSGSMMEYRNWTTALQESSFDNHVAAPIAFDGNTPSASYLDLITRYSFDDDKDLSVSYNQWFTDASADTSFTSSATPVNYSSGLGDHFSSVVDETKMKVPNLGPSGRSSNKVRIESDFLIDKAQKDSPELKFGKSIVIPSYDNAPIDSNQLGIFFSPSAPIDEDIILSMPNLDFDQYIGDPRDQYKEQYTGLTTARNLYWQKYSGPNNFWDYMRLLKYYDSSLYKQLRDLVPARANATIGILVEPTILERDKIIIGKKPTFEPQHHTTDIDAMQYISESAAYRQYENNINWSAPFGINKYKMETGSYMSASSYHQQLETDLNFSHPFRVNFHTQESGSFISASSEYTQLDSKLGYSHPFNVNFHTQESGSFVSSSAIYEDIMSDLNLYDPYRINNYSKTSGSVISMSADFSSLEAPSYTVGQIAAGTGSSPTYLRTILSRPSLYGIGNTDESGWYGQDYYNATIQEGSQISIFEEVTMPVYENGVLSYQNYEIEYYYSSSLSASLGLYYSSSFTLSDFDNQWDQSTGTNNLFFEGCIQTDDTTVSDQGNRYGDQSPVVDVTITTPTRLVTTDSPDTPLDVI